MNNLLPNSTLLTDFIGSLSDIFPNSAKSEYSGASAGGATNSGGIGSIGTGMERQQSGIAKIWNEFIGAINGDTRREINAANQAAANAQMEYQTQSAQDAMNFEAEQARLNREWQFEQNHRAMDFEAEQAQLNREWQEEMSNSAYTRAVADMKNAGLNPILLATKGFSGASTPSGDSASGYTSSGNVASGKSSSGAKAIVSDSVYVTSMLNSMFNSAAKVAKAALLS